MGGIVVVRRSGLDVLCEGNWSLGGIEPGTLGRSIIQVQQRWRKSPTEHQRRWSTFPCPRGSNSQVWAVDGVAKQRSSMDDL